MRSKSIITCLTILAIPFLLACKSDTKNDHSSERDIIKGLKDVSDFPIGSAFSLRQLIKDEKLHKLQVDNFNSITAGNDMKMRNIAKVKGEYNFVQADMMLAYAEKNNQRLFGHTLIWHSSTPDWVSEIADDTHALDAFMKDYIHTYVGRYKGKVDGWDVVNEGMNTIGGDYRETLWYKAFGKDYIAKAFRYAHEADPEAVLFYNDFNIERDTAKLRGVIRMIEELKAEGVPISGLGFQMHIRMDIPDDVIAYALKKGAETGLKIHLSEVDIIFNKHDDSKGGGVQIYNEISEEMRQQQAEKYQNLAAMYRTIIPKDQQYGITFWGFNDRDSWIKGFFNLKDWPCIFDENLEPKPAYYGFMRGLKND
jgi:endo-1,4-beta-xylanase